MAVKKLKNSFLPHNNVRLVKGGSEFFTTLIEMINSSKYVIYLQVYIFDEDETGMLVANALIEAAYRKVQVYVLVDGYASQSVSNNFIKQLRDADIKFRMFEPLLKSKHFYFGRRLHHKVVVVDSRYGLVAGLNISNRYNDLPENVAWLDWALYVEGSAVSILERICIKRMRFGKVKVATESNNQIHIPTEEKNCEVRVRENDWVGRKRQIFNSYIEMFRYATTEIVIMSPYFLPGNEFRKRMRLATRRGVKIQLILSGISDIFVSKYAERFMYRWLLDNNIEIYEYQRQVLHGKIATCDEAWITVGSFNINNLSAHASIELNLDVNNPHFAKHVAGRLKEIIKNDCVQITKEVYERRTNFLDRILQRLAYDFLRMMLFLFTFYFKQRE